VYISQVHAHLSFHWWEGGNSPAWTEKNAVDYIGHIINKSQLLTSVMVSMTCAKNSHV